MFVYSGKAKNLFIDLYILMKLHGNKLIGVN
jgi:hypothetical protein